MDCGANGLNGVGYAVAFEAMPFWHIVTRFFAILQAELLQTGRIMGEVAKSAVFAANGISDVIHVNSIQGGIFFGDFAENRSEIITHTGIAGREERVSGFLRV